MRAHSVAAAVHKKRQLKLTNKKKRTELEMAFKRKARVRAQAQLRASIFRVSVGYIFVVPGSTDTCETGHTHAQLQMCAYVCILLLFFCCICKSY